MQDVFGTEAWTHHGGHSRCANSALWWNGSARGEAWWDWPKKTSNHLDVYPITSGIFIAWATGSFAVRCWSNRCPRFCLTFQGMRENCSKRSFFHILGGLGLSDGLHTRFLGTQARLTLCVVDSAHIHDFWWYTTSKQNQQELGRRNHQHKASG